MPRSGEYQTKQRAQILQYLASHSSAHMTAAELLIALNTSGTPIGSATVYRQLEKLEAQGLVRRYALDDRGSACWQYAGAEVPVLAASARSGEGLEQVREAMRGRLCCLTGQSGVGKSTLLNALLGLSLETGEISRKIQRGKNTTRHAELLVKDGLRVLDTAGFSLLELDGGMEPVTLKEYYPEFAVYEGKCRFEPCYHDREPGCAVTAACGEGAIHPQRLARYRALLAEVRQAWRERYD